MEEIKGRGIFIVATYCGYDVAGMQQYSVFLTGENAEKADGELLQLCSISHIHWTNAKDLPQLHAPDGSDYS